MRVLCRSNTGRDLSEKHWSAGGTTAASVFDLELGQEYIVYGINLWRGLLHYLLVGAGWRPAWYPAELFQVVRAELPSDWYFELFGQSDSINLNAVWGYTELVLDEEHFDELANLESKALEIFETRKRQIDSVS